MAGNAAFLKSEVTLAWIGQFDPADQPIAIALLRAMTLVSRDAFADRLRTLILRRLNAGNKPIGLYVERELPQELPHRPGVPFRLFEQTDTKVKRAYGPGLPPVEPTRAYDADVGSEGLIAQLVSELCREHPKRLYNHPGPDKIRNHRIRRFVLVTDFIGSGKRARTYIEAAWRVRSVKSWWSARATKGLAFEVVAYAAVQTGRTKVENHPSRPEVHVVVGCPTVENKFGLDLRQRVRSLCLCYSPVKGNSLSALGFGNAGALIAFAHGIPNNAPLILHKRGKKKKWAPLFPARVTSATRSAFATANNDIETVRARLIQMRQTRLAAAEGLSQCKPHVRGMLLVMAALNRPMQSVETISRKSGLTIIEVEQHLALALSHGWIDGQHRLTPAGQGELEHLRRDGSRTAQIKSLPSEPETFYYPTSLRVPLEPSS